MQTVKLQLFISSPGDVAEERALTKRVIERLQGEFATRAKLEPVFWEHEPLLATSSFQEQIIKPSETDIVICILWSRLGTRLPPRFTRADGSRYASGTEFEFEDAALAHQQLGKPDLLVYRKTAEPFVSLKDKDALLEKLKQKESLDSFVSRWFHDHKEGTLVAAFHSFESVAKFEELLELHLRKLIEKQLPASSETFIPPSWQGGSPFRGLQTFEMEHAPIFFGRTKATSEVLDALRQGAAASKPFVMVLGMSGSGKSSLVRAGVLPMLIQPGVIEGIGIWRHTIFRPSDNAADLLAGLANALLQETVLPELKESGPVGELANLLRDTPQAVPALIKSSLALAATTFAKKENLEQIPKTNLALVVDQLEELFTLPNITNQERESFINALDALVRSGSVWGLATLRSDFYPRCAELEKLVSLKEGAGQYDLLPPSPSEIGQLIRQPALAAGLGFEEDAKSGERLEDLLRDAAVKNPQVLPLLEFTLEELYNRRKDSLLTLDAYRKLGGVEGALAHRAETVFNALSATIQAALPQVMQSLINVETDGTATAKRALLSSFATPESNAFLQALVDARLLTSDLTSDKEAVVSVTHEALLRHWPRLVEWVQSNQDRLRLQGRLGLATKRWLEENRSPDFLWSQGKPLAEAGELSRERLEPSETTFIASSLQKGRRLRFIRRVAVASLALLALVAGLAAFQANRQRLLAETASQQATLEAERAEQEKQRAEEEKERAENERQRAAEEQQRAEEETLRAESEQQRAEKAATTASKTREFLVNLLSSNDPSVVLGDIPNALELLDTGAAQARDTLAEEPEVQADLFNIIGKLYLSYGRYQDALPLLENALKTRRELSSTSDLLSSLTNLGAAHRRLGNYDEAEGLYREAFDLAKQSSGEDSLDAADAANNLGVFLSDRSQFDEAETLYRYVLKIYGQKLSQDDPRRVSSLSNFAQVLEMRDNLSEAETLYREAIALGREYESNTPLLAFALSNLSGLLRSQSKNSEAETLLREALTLQQTIYGDTHPDTLITLSNLASLLSGTSRYKEAETMYRDLLPKLETSFGADHPEVANALNNFGNTLYQQSNYREAKPLLERALAIYELRSGANSADATGALSNLAGIAKDEGELESAETYYRRQLEVEEMVYGKDSLTVTWTQVNLGALLVQKGDYDTAETLLSEALQTYRQILGENNESVSWALQQLGTLYFSKGDFAKAQALLLESLELDRALAPVSTQIISSLNTLSLLYFQQNDLEQAATYRIESLELSHKVYGEDNLETISAMTLLASIREKQERFDEASGLVTNAVTLYRPTLQAADSRLTLATMLTLEARILLKLNRHSEAEPLLQEALEMRRTELPEGHWQIANAENLLGEIYTRKGDYQQAEDLLLPSYKILNQELGRSDDNTRSALGRVVQLYKAWNKPELAKQYEEVESNE